MCGTQAGVKFSLGGRGLWFGCVLGQVVPAGGIRRVGPFKIEIQQFHELRPGVPGGERRFLEALPGAPVWPARGVVSSACSDAGECVCGRRPSLSVIAGKGCDYGGVRPISQPEKGARGLPRS